MMAMMAAPWCGTGEKEESRGVGEGRKQGKDGEGRGDF